VENAQIESLLSSQIECSEVKVTGDGSHFDAHIVSGEFEGLLPLKRQQKVFAVLGEHVTSGAIHALNIKAFTPSEWEQAKKLQVQGL